MGPVGRGLAHTPRAATHTWRWDPAPFSGRGLLGHITQDWGGHPPSWCAKACVRGAASMGASLRTAHDRLPPSLFSWAGPMPFAGAHRPLSTAAALNGGRPRTRRAMLADAQPEDHHVNRTKTSETARVSPRTPSPFRAGVNAQKTGRSLLQFHRSIRWPRRFAPTVVPPSSREHISGLGSRSGRDCARVRGSCAAAGGPSVRHLFHPGRAAKCVLARRVLRAEARSGPLQGPAP